MRGIHVQRPLRIRRRAVHGDCGQPVTELGKPADGSSLVVRFTLPWLSATASIGARTCRMERSRACIPDFAQTAFAAKGERPIGFVVSQLCAEPSSSEHVLAAAV